MDELGKRERFELLVGTIFEYLSSATYPDGYSKDQKRELRKKCASFKITDRALFFIGKNKDKNARVISSREEQLRIVKACHEGIGDTKESQAMSGHLGRDKTQARITERFYWSSITNDVGAFLKTCDVCQRNNKVFRKPLSELQSIPVKDEAFHRIGIDLVGPLPETADGFKFLVTATCAYTKWVESEPLRSKSAMEVAKFTHKMICRHGCFAIQISDQGREFVNQISSELHRLTGVDHRITSAYHPQCNGLTEKQNQTTKTMLLKHLENQEEWADILDSVLFAYRTSKHASTGYSPFFLLYNRQPRLPVELMVENAAGETQTTELEDISMDDRIAAMERIRLVAATKAMGNIKKAQEHQKKNYDRRTDQGSFGIGEEVLMEQTRNKKRCGGQLEAKFIGPYMVENILKKGCYKLSRNGKVLKAAVNGKRLKLYHRRQDETTEEPSKHESDGDDQQEDQVHGQSSPQTEDKNADLNTNRQSNRHQLRLIPLNGEQLGKMQNTRYWLTDIEVNAAQALLRQQYTFVGGLQDVCLSERNQFDVEVNEFVQIYNANGNHWVVLSSIDCETGTVAVYDSLYRTVQKDTIETIRGLLNTDVHTVVMPQTQKQHNGSSCGVFAIAVATAILSGQDVSNTTFDSKTLRKHLAKCFIERKMSPFPTTQCVTATLPRASFTLKD